MKTKNYSKLVEKYFPDKDPFLKETLIQLLEDNIFAITEKNNKFFISKKSRKNLPVGYILPEEKYNSEKYKNIRKIFPTLEEFRICFYNNLIEIPYCCICGKEKVHLIGNFKFSQTCGSLECQDALHKQTFLKKYGYENPMQSPEIQVKIKQNSLNKYGVENWQSRPEVLQKRIQTNMERYGVPFAQQTEEAKKKQEETNLKKWGYKSTAQNPEVKKKNRETNLRNHNGVFNMSDPEVRKKWEETNKRNHGGVLHYHTPEFRKAISRKVARSFSKYLYDNLKFDSKEELSFYIYHTESLNEKVEREPIIIPYEVDGESHDYYPDFRINDQLYEIKGTWGVN